MVPLRLSKLADVADETSTPVGTFPIDTAITLLEQWRKTTPPDAQCVCVVIMSGDNLEELKSRLAKMVADLK